MIEKISWQGWNNVYRIWNETVQILVLADVGPRIIWYGFRDGENILHQVASHAGLSGGSEFRLYGGHRLWVSPEVERTYFPDNGPVSVQQHGRRVRFTAPVEDRAPGTNLQSANPNGRFEEQMGGIFSPSGWGAYFVGDTLFVKRAPVIENATYPDFGCNLEVFTNRDFLELETLGATVVLRTGEQARHSETWQLFANVAEGEDENWIRSTILPLVNRH